MNSFSFCCFDGSKEKRVCWIYTGDIYFNYNNASYTWISEHDIVDFRNCKTVYSIYCTYFSNRLTSIMECHSTNGALIINSNFVNNTEPKTTYGLCYQSGSSLTFNICIFIQNIFVNLKSGGISTIYFHECIFFLNQFETSSALIYPQTNAIQHLYCFSNISKRSKSYSYSKFYYIFLLF